MSVVPATPDLCKPSPAIYFHCLRAAKTRTMHSRMTSAENAVEDSRIFPIQPPPPLPPPTFNATPTALAVAGGFLPHEFHLLPPHSEQVRCLVAACTAIRSTVLFTLRTYIDKMAKEADAHTLESTVEGLFRVLPSQEVELFKELLVDGVCLASGFCTLTRRSQQMTGGVANWKRNHLDQDCH
ncbi:DNA ligase [Echinococcus multilocularis]|uniref:DNA ligase n=1 Tax=Echinococcus multilocularis TaxID=6211 RepID=A0A0S4MLZ6_ECHMU|nr:DNA ligase [Echinococcus multilocularis]